MNKTLLLLPFFFIIYGKATAQSIPDSLAGYYFYDLETNEDLSPFYDNLSGLYANPIDLNNCTINDLTQIPFMDYNAAFLIANYKKDKGRIASKIELYNIDGIDKNLLNNIMPYVFASPADLHNEQLSDTTASLSFNNSFQNRFYSDPEVNQTSSLKIVNKLNIKPVKDISLTYIQAKDAGENFGDFSSYNLYYKSRGILRTFIAGDFRIEAGQKLLFTNTPYVSRNLLSAVNANNFNIIPQTSAYQSNYFRGVAGMLHYGPFNLTGFYSSRYYDASIDTSTGNISTIIKTGLHRTNSELNNQNRLLENLAGGNLDFSFNRTVNGGFIYYHSQLAIPVKEYGRSFNYLSGYYNVHLSKLKVFGETALFRKYLSTYSGFDYLFSKEIKYTFTYRNYPAGFYNLHGAPLRQSADGNSSEEGIMNSFLFKNKNISLNLIYDQFSIVKTLPSNQISYSGSDLRLYYCYTFSRLFSIEGKLGYTDNDAPEPSIEERKSTYRIDAVLSPGYRLGLRYRFEYSRKYNNDITTNGYTFFQDIAYNILEKLKTNLRIIYFYKSSYEYENDIQDIFTNSQLSGEGFKWYAMVQYVFNNLLNISAKYIYEMNNLFPDKDRSILNMQINLFL